MDKLKMHSPDLSQENIARIRGLFPSCVTEARDETTGQLRLALDFDQLRQELSDHIVDGPQERYRLDWPGKREALVFANSPIAKSLRPSLDESVAFESTQNLFIEGDNLDALKLIQESYLQKVKLIYIDPPYNTGRDFVYSDNFTEKTFDYMRSSNQSDGAGSRLVANTEANGRFHSDWLSMMYSRLRLAQRLLQDDGAIFVSIDDNEVRNLRALLDEIFGSENFVATIIWHKMDSPKNSAVHFSEDHDYVVVYAKNIGKWRPHGLPRTEEMTARYKNPDNDQRGPWLLGDLAARNFYAQGRYPITTKSGRVIPGPPAGSYWRVSKEKFEELDRDNRIWWGDRGDNRPGIKRFLSEVRDGVVPQTYWAWKDVGSTRNAKQEFSRLMSAGAGENLFITPKPTKLIERIIQIGTNKSGSDVVFDFFAGSGTTGHSTWIANRKDGGDRRFILVQLPEASNEPELPTIAELTKERLRRAAKQLVEEEAALCTLDAGFRVLKVDTSNMQDVYYRPDQIDQKDLLAAVDNVKPDRSAEDLLFQVLVDWGVDLTLPIEREMVQGKTVFFVDGNALLACFDTGVTEELVKELAGREPLRVVFRDNGFVSDAVKINVEQVFRQVSPGTDVKSI